MRLDLLKTLSWPVRGSSGFLPTSAPAPVPAPALATLTRTRTRNIIMSASPQRATAQRWREAIKRANESRAEQNAASSGQAMSTSASSSGSAAKRLVDGAGAAYPPNKYQRQQFSAVSENRRQREKEREAELVDLEQGMQAYNWERPNFPLSSTAPRIVYIRSATDGKLGPALTELVERPNDAAEGDPTVLGFDMEWKVNFRAGQAMFEGRTALIQICSRSLVVILHIAHLVPTDNIMPPLPPALERLLLRSDILKTGVRIEGDAIKLQKEFRQTTSLPGTSANATEVQGIRSAGLLELSRLAQEVDPERWGSHGKRLISLRELVAVYLGRKLLKDSARLSDWSQPTLTGEQLRYAAADVMSGLEVYEALRRRAALLAQGRHDELQMLPMRKTFEALKQERRAKQLQGLKDARSAPSNSAFVDPLLEAASQELDESHGSFASAISFATTSEYADAPLAGEDSQPAGGHLGESQMSTTEDPAVGASESQMSTTEDFQAESQTSTVPDASFRQSSFYDAVKRSTTALTDSLGVARSYEFGSKRTAAAPAAPPPPRIYSYQKTFDQWFSSTGDGQLTFKEISKRNNVQLNTAAGYVLKSFLEDRHATPDTAGTGTGTGTGTGEGDVAVPAELKERLAAELADPELKPTLFRYSKWLKKHDIIEIPEKEPRPAAARA
ncbi:hypothetical protein OC842_000273 [Tilletia horrida]|uniref:3'-5' exonuclease domain-containing protein n=1 Tax=Tilletia horrida TaxID=155126 RepID=A0AAN6GH91_9BASI|nr:hypothetical protein OC842_000273 [Tilletia horrida]